MEYASILLTAAVAAVMVKLFDNGTLLVKGVRVEFLLDRELERRGIEQVHVCFLGPAKSDLHVILQRNGHTCDITIGNGLAIGSASEMARVLDETLQDWEGLENA